MFSISFILYFELTWYIHVYVEIFSSNHVQKNLHKLQLFCIGGIIALWPPHLNFCKTGELQFCTYLNICYFVEGMII